ncbi:MAG: hypothetical protein CMK60_09605 [Proteobacteria bacterium]|jgi:hypothetical protein|nr:hypothetical protein [Pseudomonadota bacterium]MDP6136264.1 hypothetical protein [Arenicellales bacterium]MDP7220890.1 hypothetical protein [Arenicellales bacterium]HCF72483.1 hypothetical protein [Gammaproteobacteria bacterium]|tara:strand:- start:91 stop:408 length:318 start_codon:yes stop_codon:yes gene_type:complete
MKISLKNLIFSMVVLSPLAASALLPGDAENGLPLHEFKCAGCHVAQSGGDGSGIYTRSEGRVKTVEGLMGMVEFCNEQTRAGFNEHELEDIVAYLNEAFYQFEID